MYRPHHHPSFSLENCIILSNRLPLVHVPKQFTYYFINSKRRFFLYLKHKEEMRQLIDIFEKQNVKFYQRKSIFPDRQENQEIAYHSNYKYKKKDLRWSLKPETRFREPKNKFDEPKIKKFKQELSNYLHEQKITLETNKLVQISQQPKPSTEMKAEDQKVVEMQVQQTAPEYVADFGEIKIKSQQVLDIINNIQLVKALFKAERKR